MLQQCVGTAVAVCPNILAFYIFTLLHVASSCFTRLPRWICPRTILAGMRSEAIRKEFSSMSCFHYAFLAGVVFTSGLVHRPENKQFGSWLTPARSSFESFEVLYRHHGSPVSLFQNHHLSLFRVQQFDHFVPGLTEAIMKSWLRPAALVQQNDAALGLSL